MRKTAISTVVLSLSLAFIGCPPAENGDGGDSGKSDAEGGDAEGGDAENGGGDADSGDADSGDDGGDTASQDADLSHVEVGQKYVYETMGGGQQVWEVTKVEPNKVTYDMITMADMGTGELQPVGDPMEQTWEWKVPEATGEETTGETADTPDVTKEMITVSGVEFTTFVMEQAGSKTWMNVNPGSDPADFGEEVVVMRFPLTIKSESGGNVAMELVEIKDPE